MLVEIVPLRDLLFIHDATGSQRKYIRETTQKCKEICALIRRSGKFDTQEGLRMGLIAYRDHPQRYVSANDFLCKDYGGFTYDEHEVLENLDALTASGGGDLPEAVADALHNALQLEWRPNATKVAVLLTDAAPHGIGERKDAFPEGCPLRELYSARPSLSWLILCPRPRPVVDNKRHGQEGNHSRA